MREPVGKCARVQGGTCTQVSPCEHCLNARCRAVRRVGSKFVALGAAVHRAVIENA